MGAEVKSMEIKKNHSASLTPKASTSQLRKAEAFVENIKTEFSKINWTSKEELRVYTKIVVLTTFAFGMSVYFVDLFIQGFLNTLSVVMRLVFG